MRRLIASGCVAFVLILAAQACVRRAEICVELSAPARDGGTDR